LDGASSPGSLCLHWLGHLHSLANPACFTRCNFIIVIAYDKGLHNFTTCFGKLKKVQKSVKKPE
jgi:hypothetical protein